MSVTSSLVTTGKTLCGVAKSMKKIGLSSVRIMRTKKKSDLPNKGKSLFVVI